MEHLRHYSNKPVTLERREHGQLPGFKPFGFWVSVGDDWERWCRSEGFRIEGLSHVHEVCLSPDANILRLCSALEIDMFTERYGSGWRYYTIDWPKVASEYQGIIIAPYVWSRRLHDGTFWYYPWDCASGCIWDLAAVQSLELLPQPAEKGRETPMRRTG